MNKLESKFLISEERILLKSHRVEKDGRKRDRVKFVLLANDGWSYTEIAVDLFLDDQIIINY